MKICTRCEIEKDEGEFYKQQDKKSGLSSHCRQCHKLKRQMKHSKVIDERKQKEEIFNDEIWRPFYRFPLYEVSTLGRIRNVKRHNILLQYKNINGYMDVPLKNGDIRKTMRVHRIVAEVFLNNYYGYKTINHRNKDRTCNKLYNLEYASQKMQMEHQLSFNPPNKKGYKKGTSDLTDLPNEEWKSINNYPDYFVSSMGRIKYPLPLWNGTTMYRISIGGDRKEGNYKTVGLKNENGKKKFMVHRLVAEAFCPNPNNYDVINHRDLNKYNNVASNLEYMTQSQNIQHAYDNGAVKKLIKPIYQLDFNGMIVKKWNTIKEARTALKFSEAMISKALSKKVKNKSAGGFQWIYADENYVEGSMKYTQQQNKTPIIAINIITNKETTYVGISDAINDLKQNELLFSDHALKSIRSIINRCIKNGSIYNETYEFKYVDASKNHTAIYKKNKEEFEKAKLII